MRCYLVRHAQTVWNGQNRFQGRGDSPLSALGQEQARRLAEHFTAHPVGAVWSSALGRTITTAQTIAGPLGLRPVVEPGLGEMDLGAWEGLTAQEVDGRFGGAYQRWRESPSQVTIPDGEPIDQFRQRVRTAFASVVAAASTDRLLVVAHGGVIASLLADWLHTDFDRLLTRVVLNNAGITAVEWNGRQPHTILWINGIAHLASHVTGGLDS